MTIILYFILFYIHKLHKINPPILYIFPVFWTTTYITLSYHSTTHHSEALEAGGGRTAALFVPALENEKKKLWKDVEKYQIDTSTHQAIYALQFKRFEMLTQPSYISQYETSMKHPRPLRPRTFRPRFVFLLSKVKKSILRANVFILKQVNMGVKKSGI